MPHRLADISVEFDELTDLPTMVYFRRYEGRYIEAARRDGHDCYLVYFNLENFSAYNERYGFEEGDKLLSLAAVAIQSAFPGFLLSRFSEDHFFLVCQSRHITSSINEVRDQLHMLGKHANVELKAGIYAFGEESVEIGVACDRAKIACESIAHRYDRTYRWYDDALKWRIERGQYIESHIDSAIENGWIKVYFQPIVRSITGEVCEFEALARWDDPRYGMLSPAIFIEVLEEARLIHKLDAHIVRLVCREWTSSEVLGGARIPVSINLSRLDFELCDVFEMVDGAAREYGIPRQMLHVEVTESALNDSTNLLSREIAHFRSVGYQVWLDDFGSGYSSLNTLKDYVFDVVKIDMVFLREFQTKPKSRVIISSIVNMAKQLSMQTLIEGVETAEQFEFLRDIGCEFIQGYLIGRPLPIDQTESRVQAQELELSEAMASGYYDRMGAVNLLSAAPFSFPWEVDETSVAKIETLPLALVERRDGAVSFRMANDAFEGAMLAIGFDGIGDLAQLANRVGSVRGHTIQQAFNSAMRSGQTEVVDLILNGFHCAMRVRRVSSYEDVHSFLVSFIIISRFADVTEEQRAQIALQCMYAVYDEINIVDLSDGMVSTVYRGNTSYPAIAKNELFVDATNRFVRVYVHPEDRDRCSRFLDLDSVESRVEAAGRNHLADAFRVLQPSGSYGWITSTLIPVSMDGAPAMLVCVRNTNKEVISSVCLEDEISKSMLWDTLLDLVPAGVFWKDVNRRFLGVNKNFLDFYSFDSVNDVLGKTDEDMGWHVDTDPFMNNELRVIERGESVLNTPGTCLSHGVVCNISASKIPLRRNGEVVGLLGYFTEQTDGARSEGQSLLPDGFSRMAATDELTGIPNFVGIRTSALSYQEVFRRGGPDFVYGVIDIQGMSDLNDVYGRSFGNRTLKVVAEKLTRACGVTAVVARVGGDRFAVLRQVEGSWSAGESVGRLRGVIEGIQEVDGIRVSLRSYSGGALASECEDVDELFALAEDRMHSSRSEKM